MEFHAGKVTAVIGENGAGKSTLMKILSGVYTEFEGRILLRGQSVRFSGPREAQDKGIVIIHQELNLIPYLSITENIFLGRELLNRWGALDRAAMRETTVSLLGRLRLKVHPDARIADLKVGQQQVVEIAKALLINSEVIIMDEPTSAISNAEVSVLFEIIGDLRRENKAIVYISHKLDELQKIADRYVVLRDGCFVEAGEMKAGASPLLVQKMVGREIRSIRARGKATGPDQPDSPAPTAELLRVRNICLRHPEKRGQYLLKDISFTQNKGEITGIFGLMGAGRTELLETLFGMHPRLSSGDVFLEGKKTRIQSPSDAMAAGLALIPEDRKRDGLVLQMDVQENIGLVNMDKIERLGFLMKGKEAALAEKYIGELGIKGAATGKPVRNLSGGNQQKVVLAKWLACGPRLLLLDEPTRGIDIQAKKEIYKLILHLASEGLGILLVSSELPEVLALSDKILVLSEGVLRKTFSGEEATEDSILEAALPQTI
jgi:ribose transport system ATP-binding protein